MRVVAGILLLVLGVSFPMGMLVWLNGRMRRKPALLPAQVGLLLALNGILPLGCVTLGLGLMTQRLWSLAPLRTASFAAWIAVAGVLLALLVVGRRARRPADG